MKQTANTERPSTVLCIDDSPESLTLFRRLLESEGCRVLTCKNGIQGLEMAEAASPDLILTDLALPFMDGFETANRLKTILRELGRHVPVIAVSNLTASKDRDLALAAGCDGFIPKPVDVDRFIPDLLAYYGGRRDRLETAREKKALQRFHRRLLRKLEMRSEAVLLDESTELYNERYLYKRLDEEVSRSLRVKEPFSLAIFRLASADGDGPPPDEDRLRLVAQVLRQNKRAYDVAFRMDDDLFGVMLGTCPEGFASMVGGRLCEKIHSALLQQGIESGSVRLLVGTNTYDGGHLDPVAFIIRARHALTPYELSLH